MGNGVPKNQTPDKTKNIESDAPVARITKSVVIWDLTQCTAAVAQSV
jgi:hypothetical protein